jgi:hypothetical protein
VHRHNPWFFTGFTKTSHHFISYGKHLVFITNFNFANASGSCITIPAAPEPGFEDKTGAIIIFLFALVMHITFLLFPLQVQEYERHQ